MGMHYQDLAAVAEGVVRVVAESMSPGDVYDEDVLLDYVRQKFGPEDVFTDGALRDWATDNGFVEESE